MFPIEYQANGEHFTPPFNEQITNSIELSKAVTATDVSFKGYSIVCCWILTDIEKLFKHENILYYKYWEDNVSGSAEVIVLLKLISVLERKERHIEQGEIRIGFDHKKGYKKIIKSILKSNAMINKLISKIKFNVRI